MCDTDDCTGQHALAVQKTMCQFCPYRFKRAPFAAVLNKRALWKCHKSDHAVCAGHRAANPSSYDGKSIASVDDHATERRRFARGDTVTITANLSDEILHYEVRF